jgi:hypothetical protein
VAITMIGVQPVIASTGPAAGMQTYKIGEVSGDQETLSLEVACTNDLSAPGNLNLVHWSGEGESYRVYKAQDGVFGLIGAPTDSPFVDANISPDLSQQPPPPPPTNQPPEG